MTAERRGLPWRVGLIVGLGAGVVVSWAGRRAERIARRGLVDWPTAEAIAAARLRRAPGSLAADELAASEPAWAATMDRIVPRLEARLGSPLPGVVERHAVVDRAGWAAANIGTFRDLVARLESSLLGDRPADPTFGASFAALANRVIITRQIGFMLGFLGTRVLGQYDVALLSAEARPGRLLFVEENIRGLARQLDVPLADMRTWIALHEATHAFEFEAHAWLRPYLRDRLERQLAGFLEGARAFRVGGLAEVARTWARPNGDLASAFLAPAQRQALREVQVVMSLLEGFSDWVMDDIGADLLADVTVIRDRFEARRSAPRRGLDRIMARLTGLDLKLEQYRRGERFVSGIVAIGGQAALDRLWSGPDAIPTEAELDDPSAWARRMLTRPPA
ncbi:MAG TPA: zinc-dependent metalloprotease [Candidatus Limnocylindrales bacterium]